MREPPSLKNSRSPAFRLEVLTAWPFGGVCITLCAQSTGGNTNAAQAVVYETRAVKRIRTFRTQHIAFALLSLGYLQEVRHIGGHRAIVIILARGRRLLRRLWRRGRLRRFDVSGASTAFSEYKRSRVRVHQHHQQVSLFAFWNALTAEVVSLPKKPVTLPSK